MNRTAICVHNLTKEYRIGNAVRGYHTLRETIVSMTGLLRRKSSETSPIFLALDKVSLEVERGDRIGLIGRNGAGKSTLLKILSRITEPTAGYADIEGRVGSLLEVGTGFHGELTGRENILLNGAILGMKRADIQRQFDSIVSFAEVEKFIDTPVKHYSSGMYLRLAFAVAAHLEPDILLVDEVLAVGDLSFQKKCLGKMENVASQGRTVMFVSHNMGAIRAVCNKGIVLDRGRVYHTGHIGSSIQAYFHLSSLAEAEQECLFRTGFSKLQLLSHPSMTIQQHDSFEVFTTLNIISEVAGFSLKFILHDMHQRVILHLRRDSPDLLPNHRWLGQHKIRLNCPPLWLEPGLYSMHFKVEFWGNCVRQKVLSDIAHLDVGGEASGCGDAMLTPPAHWEVEEAADPNHMRGSGRDASVECQPQ